MNKTTQGQQLISEAIKLIRKGSAVHRCQILNDVMTFQNPFVQNLKISVDQFENTPSAARFEELKTALEQCKQHAIQSYAYDKIEAIFAAIDTLS